jgi:hypothetical protein
MKSANINERGFISFSVILGLGIVVATVFSAVRLLPPYIANYQFQDYIDNTARSATYSTITEADLKREIMSRARELGITLQERQLEVHKVRGGAVSIKTTYDVPVDLVARQVVLHFEPAAGNQNIVSR